jgi:hypothetical protein
MDFLSDPHRAFNHPGYLLGMFRSLAVVVAAQFAALAVLAVVASLVVQLVR